MLSILIGSVHAVYICWNTRLYPRSVCNYVNQKCYKDQFDIKINIKIQTLYLFDQIVVPIPNVENKGNYIQTTSMTGREKRHINMQLP